MSKKCRMRRQQNHWFSHKVDQAHLRIIPGAMHYDLELSLDKIKSLGGGGTRVLGMEL